MIDELQTELGRAAPELAPKSAINSAHRPPPQLTVDQRRSVVEASKLVPSPHLVNIPVESDDAALNSIVREYLAHCGYANTVSAMDKAALSPRGGQPADAAALMDKKAALTFLARIQNKGFFDTNESILEAQGMVGRICDQLPEDVAAQLWVWWTLQVSRWCPELVDSNHLMQIVLRGNATGNIGAALHLAEQCTHYVHSTRHRPSSSNRSWRRNTPITSTPPAQPPSPQLLDSLYKDIRPAVQRLYGGGGSKRQRGVGMPTTLQDLWVWNSYEQEVSAQRWGAVLN